MQKIIVSTLLAAACSIALSHESGDEKCDTPAIPPLGVGIVKSTDPLRHRVTINVLTYRGILGYKEFSLYTYRLPSVVKVSDFELGEPVAFATWADAPGPGQEDVLKSLHSVDVSTVK